MEPEKPNSKASDGASTQEGFSKRIKRLPQGPDTLSICMVCFNLDPNLYPKKHRALVMDGNPINTWFADLEQSAERAECKYCLIIHSGLLVMQEMWEDDNNFGETLLNAGTEIQFIVRPGHGLRVSVLNPESSAQTWITFEFFTLSPGDCGDMTVFGISRAVPAELDLSQCLELASAWIKNCDENHPKCRRNDRQVFPKRLIDVGDGVTNDMVFLRELDGWADPPYLTLSHCWGKNPLITTTSETIEERIKGIPIIRLPKTFRDAVQITRGLGVRYIWIDSLCIIQDDLSDWDVESMKMAGIYSGAKLNLAATLAPNSEAGFFQERWSLDPLNQTQLTEFWYELLPENSEDDPYSILVRPALHVAHDHFTRSNDYINSVADTSPLLERAWVFQERLLSRRTLHFHAEELIWECNSGLSCECKRLEDYAKGDPDTYADESMADQLKVLYGELLTDNTSQGHILDSWLVIVGEYCSLKLTKDTDRLPALSGLASRVSSHLQSDYLAGLWSQDLPRQLCWGKYTFTVPSDQPSQPGAPSWSWASVALDKSAIITTPHITYDIIHLLGFYQDSRFRVIDAKCSPNSANMFGTVGDAQLRVEGPLIAVKYQFDQNAGSHYGLNVLWFNGEDETMHADCMDGRAAMRGIAPGQSLFCLLVGHSQKENMDTYGSSLGLVSYALVLRGPAEGCRAYTRAGLLSWRSRKRASWWANAQVEGVAII